MKNEAGVELLKTSRSSATIAIPRASLNLTWRNHESKSIYILFLIPAKGTTQQSVHHISIKLLRSTKMGTHKDILGPLYTEVSIGIVVSPCTKHFPSE
ncbi:hypothetical protein M8J75_008156 [Diaphorina citri]|nr:hypothetical protein M8J75_008156 [Diaphorina citri]